MFTSEVFYDSLLRSRNGLENSNSMDIRGWDNPDYATCRSNMTAIKTARQKESITLSSS